MKKQTQGKTYDVIIIGAGPAGLTAAIYAARKSLQTLIISKDVGGQAAISGDIENYLGFSVISGPELVLKFRAHIEALKENLLLLEGKEIVDLQKDGNIFFVRDGDGDIYYSRSVILASGRKPRMLNVPGEREYLGRGVAVCAICDAPLYRDKIVAVIGGGNSAMDAILSLAPVAKKVFSINLSTVFTGDENLKTRVSKFKNVEFIKNAETLKILGDKFVTGLIYLDKHTNLQKTLSLDGVFVEIGWIPSTSFDALTAKDKFAQVLVDNNLATSVPGIFAAGDVNNAWGEQIIIAAGEGAKAALAVFDYLCKQPSA